MKQAMATVTPATIPSRSSGATACRARSRRLVPAGAVPGMENDPPASKCKATTPTSMSPKKMPVNLVASARPSATPVPISRGWVGLRSNSHRP